jgi:predicted outer membrane repeat protein
MKWIILLVLSGLILPFCLVSQSLVNSGAVITIKNGTAVKLTGDYKNQQDGRIKNAGILNLDGNWIQNSTDLIFLSAPGGLVKITGPSAHSIGGSNPSVFPFLSIETEVFLETIVAIEQQLDITSGMVSIADNDLIMFGGAPIVGANQNHFINTNGNGILNQVVDGNPVTFPIGINMNYAPVSITNNAGSDEFAVRIFDNVLENGLTGGQAGNYEETVRHSWVIIDGNDTGGTIDYDAQVEWQGGMEGTAFDRTNCAISFFDGTVWQTDAFTSAAGTDPYHLNRSNNLGYGVYTVQSASVPAIYFVTESGAGSMDGSSWANASNSIQDMIDNANDDDEIWVAAGTYYPEKFTTTNTTDRYKSFYMVSGVTLRGGFAGNEDPAGFDLSQRDFIANETVLSGDIGVPGDHTDNCFHVIYCPNISMTALDGLTIQDGFGADYLPDVFAWDGAGLYSMNSIIDCDNLTFKNNKTRRSGAIYLTQNSSLTISNSSFEENDALNAGSGGAIHAFTSDLIIDHCDFTDNTASTYGGGVFVNFGELELSDCTFENNYASASGGAVHVAGYYYLNISTSQFIGNGCYNSGGALSCGAYSGPVVTATVTDCIFSDNYSTLNGGAIGFLHSVAEVNRCIVTGNSTGTGTINYEGNGYLKICNTQLTGNSNTSSGGGMSLSGSGDFLVSNCVIADNSATFYGGGLSLSTFASPKFFNTILWGNEAGNGDEVYISADNCEPEFYYCDIAGGEQAFEGTGAGSNYGFDYDNAYNIDQDPLFVDATGDDFTLESSSPCNNNGTPPGTAVSPFPYTEVSGNDWLIYYDGGLFSLGSYDLAMNPRIYGSVIDMGAFELQQDLQAITLDVNVYLEGPFTGQDMTAWLNSLDQLPLDQPYNTSPWNYEGSESVSTIPNTDIVDWVLLEIRDATDAANATPATIVRQQAAFVLKDGSMTTSDGSGLPQIPNLAVQHDVYLVIHHRNHLAVLSAEPLTESGGVYTYDFTVSSLKAYNGGQKELSPGIWGMIAADGSANGTVGTEDLDPLWKNQAGETGYLPADYNLDAQVDNKDKNNCWWPNNGSGSEVPQ